MYANVRGAISKKPCIKNILDTKKPDIVIFVETHIMGKATLNLEGYDQVITRNRKDKGGGLLLAIRNDNDIEAMIMNIDEKHEMMWIKIKVKDQSYIFAVVYGYAGESRVEDDEIDDWHYTLEKGISEYGEEKVILVGDFNAHIGNDEEGIKGNIEKINQNGKRLRSLINRRELFIVNDTEKCQGKWTREDTNGSKSIIDFVIANENSINDVENMVIDEQHEFKVSRFMKTKKGSVEKPSDHNTIFFEIHGNKSKKANKSKQWNLKNEESMKKYFLETTNVKMKETWTEKGNIDEKYKKWIKQIKTIMYKTLHRITVNHKISNDVIKKEMGIKRKINKEIKRLQNKPNLKRIVEKLKQENIKIVDNINHEIEKEKSAKLKKRLERYIGDKEMRKNDIWKMRKNCMRKKDQRMAIKNKEGKIISTKDEIFKEYETHFKQVLTNRNTKKEYEKFEQEISKQFETCKNIKNYEKDEINKPITEKEVKNAIKSLKAGKSPGKDELGNEIFLNAGDNLIKNIVNMFNYFWENEEIPSELMKISIKSIYKGKGETSSLDNQRGLFLSSCLLKLYEKIILNRIMPKVEKYFTEFQGGGRSNRSTRDQLFILRSIIELKIYKKEKLLLQFMDLSKAFDKMVLKNILNNLWEAEIRGKIWRIIYKINEYANLTISTPFGTTNEFMCQEILKQGSVIASTLAALHVDNVNKYFEEENLGTYYGTIKIENLLFQDDIVRFEDDENKMNKANIILNIFENINKMEFHPKKTKVMEINSKNENEILLGENKLGYVKQMKYLGDIISYDGKYDEMIRERRNVIEGITAELVTIMAQINVENEISAVIQYIQAIIKPKLLANAETWNNLTTKNLELLESTLMKSIKRIMKIPFSTPSLGLLNELGILNIENEIIYKKITYMHSIITGKNEMLKKILFQQLQLPGPTWIENIMKIMTHLNLPTKFEELEQYSKYKIKKIVKNKIWQKQKQEFELYIENSKKCKKLKINTHHMKNYLSELNPKNAKTILLSRLRMIELKNNYKNKYKNNPHCTFCSKIEETINHIIQCPKLPFDVAEMTKIEPCDLDDVLYGDDCEELDKLARVVNRILEEREEIIEAQKKDQVFENPARNLLTCESAGDPCS